MTNLQSEIGQIKLKNTALENSNKKEKESNEKLSKELGVANASIEYLKTESELKDKNIVKIEEK